MEPSITRDIKAMTYFSKDEHAANGICSWGIYSDIQRVFLSQETMKPGKTSTCLKDGGYSSALQSLPGIAF